MTTLLRRLTIATAALPVLTVVPVRALSVGALVALGLALTNREPESESLGRRGQTTPPEAEWHPERRHTDPPRRHTADTPEPELDGWREGRR